MFGGFVTYSEEKSRNEDAAANGLTIGITFTILSVIVIPCVYFARHKITVAIALIKEGSK